MSGLGAKIKCTCLRVQPGEADVGIRQQTAGDSDLPYLLQWDDGKVEPTNSAALAMCVHLIVQGLNGPLKCQ